MSEFEDAKKSEAFFKEYKRKLQWRMQLKKIREEREKENNRGIEPAPKKGG
jgi:hypothetical protein